MDDLGGMTMPAEAPPGRIDLHGHLLPGIDDGCGTSEESLECIRRLLAHGFVGSVCTPHVTRENYPENTPENIARAVAALEERVAAAGLDYALWPGGEVRIARSTVAWLEEQGVPTLGSGRWVLVDHWGPTWPAAAEELFAAVHARGLSIDILVSNAGFFFFGEAVDAALPQANAMLQLHVVTPSLLCTLFGRPMRARRRGHILLVSSISAFRDVPSIGYYGSSKKYLRGFAASLRSELGVYGVNVTCLTPGATATALYDPNVVPVDLATRLGVMMDAKEVAAAGLQALFERRAECIPGRMNRLLAHTAALLPQAVIDAARRHAPWLPPIKQPPR
jgi:short-subunit dehydrogenase